MGAASLSPDPGREFYEKYTVKELQILLSPHHFSRKANHDKAQLVTDHIQITRDGTTHVKNKLSCQFDHHYGVQDGQSFDIYGTDLPDTAPVFFWIHGGGWQFGEKGVNGYFAATLHGWGFKTIVLGYTLAPRATVSHMVSEVKDGLRAAFRLFPKSDFVLGGHSAGAHLASCVIHDKDFPCKQIKRVFLVSGVFDLRPCAKTTFNKKVNITPHEEANLSSLIQDGVNEAFLQKDAQVLVTVGKYETDLFLTHAKLYSDHLNDLKVTSSWWVADGDDHFSIIETIINERSSMTQRLKSFIIDLVPKRSLFSRLFSKL